MNLPKILEILRRQSMPDMRNCFVDGALRSPGIIVSGNCEVMREIIPGRTLYDINGIDKIPPGELVMFDPAAIVAILASLTGQTINSPRETTRNLTGWRVIQSNWKEKSQAEPMAAPQVARIAVSDAPNDGKLPTLAAAPAELPDPASTRGSKYVPDIVGEPGLTSTGMDFKEVIYGEETPVAVKVQRKELTI